MVMLVDRVAAATAYNAANTWKKRGITLLPIRYKHVQKMVADVNDDLAACVTDHVRNAGFRIRIRSDPVFWSGTGSGFSPRIPESRKVSGS